MHYEIYNTKLKKWEKVKEDDFKPGEVIWIDNPKHIREVSDIQDIPFPREWPENDEGVPI